MEDLLRQIDKSNQRGGGPSAATPFWFEVVSEFRSWTSVALLLFVIMSVTATHFFLKTRDTMLRRVPSNAVVYIHAQGRQSSYALRRIPNLESLKPSEAASFATLSDGKLRWTVLLRWDALNRISEQERQVLAENGARPIGRGTFSVGAEDLIVFDTGLGDSFADSQQFIAALATMRGVARTQGLFYPASIPQAEDMPEVIRTMIPNKPLALSVTERGVSQRVVVLAEKTEDETETPESLSSRTGIAAPTPMLVPTTDGFSLTLSDNSYNLVPTLFADVESKSAAMGVPENDELEMARESLIELLKGPISVIIDKFEAGTDEKLRFAVLLPDQHAEACSSAITRYLNAAWPEQTVFSGPDGTEKIEFRAYSGRHAYTPAAYSEVRTIVSAKETGFSFPLKEVDNGLIFASDTEMLNFALNSVYAPSLGCIVGAQKSLIIGDVQKLFEYMPFFSLFFDKNEVRHMVIQENVDNQTFFCGYQQ